MIPDCSSVSLALAAALYMITVAEVPGTCFMSFNSEERRLTCHLSQPGGLRTLWGPAESAGTVPSSQCNAALPLKMKGLLGV